MAVRPPPTPIGAPEGVAIALAGGAVTTPEGQRLVIPRRAAAEALPVLLRELPAADFPPLLPAGVSLVEAVTVDFHGGRLVLPAALSISRPPDLAASATVLVGRLVEVGNVTYLSLVGPATSTAGGRLQFDGLLDEGRYAFVLAGEGLGFVTGGVTDEFGAAQGNMVASTNRSPLASVTTAEGRYFLAAPPGPVTVTVLDPATGNVVTGTATIPNLGGFASLDITLAPTGPRLLKLNPADGTQAVPLITVVEAIFSEALNPASAIDGLTLEGPSGRVDGLLTLTPDGRKLTFTPNQTLADSAVYTVTVAAALSDLAGNLLENPTASLSPPWT